MDALRTPAEWEPHRALWLAMPYDEEVWGGHFEGARDALRLIVRELRAGEGEDQVELLVPPNFEERVAEHQHLLPYGDIWLRDTGPIFTQRGASLEAACFAFNGWGEKYVMAGDTLVAEAIAKTSGHPARQHPLVLEGGALEGNGQHTFLSTRQCLLNGNRNPGLQEAQVEAILAEALGCEQLIWIDRGLLGDHTDGHIDNLARFVDSKTVVCTESAASDPNAEIHREVRASLLEARTAQGEALELCPLPSPGRVEGNEGPMPASYCNFLITNGSVLVPVFDVAADLEALSVFAQLFPSRRIVPVPAFALLTGGGTVHCISQQEPLGPAHV